MRTKASGAYCALRYRGMATSKTTTPSGKKHRIAVIGGDGIGPEVVNEALKVVRSAGAQLETTDFDLGAKGSIYVTRQTLFTHIATRETNQQMAEDLFEVVGSGKVKIHIEQRYALGDAAQAHRDLEARKTTGSTLLTL